MEDYEESSFQKGFKVHETEKDIIAEAVVAGVPAENVNVEIEDGVITIKADSRQEVKEEESYKSSSYQYYYTCALSGGKWNKATADVKHGVVTVTIPKENATRPKKITVKASESK